MSQSDGAATRPNTQPSQPNTPAGPGISKPTTVIRTVGPPDAARAHQVQPVSSTATAAKRATAIVRTQRRRQRIFLIALLGVAVLLGAAGTAFFYLYLQPNVLKPLGQIMNVSQTPVGQRIDEKGTPVA